MTVRLVLVDDHHLFRAGVRAELAGAFDIVGEAGTVAQAIALIEERAPDVVLLDVHLPDGGGLAVLEAFRHPGRAPGATGRGLPAFLALSVSDAAEDVVPVVRAGARGYVTKTIATAALVDAIQRVHQGDAYFSPRLAAFVLQAFSAPEPAAADADADASSTSSRRASATSCIISPAAIRTSASRAGWASAREPSRRTSARCCASCSSRHGTSSAAGRACAAWPTSSAKPDAAGLAAPPACS